MFRGPKSHKKSKAKTTASNLEIDLTPLLDAAREGEWEKVDALLDSGVSLHWLDHQHYQTALKILAREGSNSAVMGLLKIAGQRRLDIRAVLSQAYLGAFLGDNAELIKSLDEFVGDDEFKLLYELMANVERGNKSYEDLINLVALRELNLSCLATGGHIDTAVRLLKYDCLNVDLSAISAKSTKVILALRKVMIAVAQNKSLPYLKTAEKILKELKISKDVEQRNAFIIAGAAAIGDIDLVLAELKKYPNNSALLQDAFYTALETATEFGHKKLALKICDLIKSCSVISPDVYFSILIRVAGSMLVNEHFEIVRELLLRAPTDDDYSCVIPELDWSEEQILHMFKIVHDPLICLQLAACIEVDLDEAANEYVEVLSNPEWLRLLKNKYGLGEMSNDGFAAVVKNPTLVYLLLRSFFGATPENESGLLLPDLAIMRIAYLGANSELSENDIKIFLTQMFKSEDAALRVRDVHRFMSSPTMTRDSVESVALFKEIKLAINEILQSSKNKDLRDKIYSAGSISKIYSLLQAAHQNEPAVKECLKYFSERYTKIPAVKKMMDEWRPNREANKKGI